MNEKTVPAMAKPDEPPTQKTQPKTGEPVEIPIPTREEFLRNLAKVAPPVPSPPSSDGREDD